MLVSKKVQMLEAGYLSSLVFCAQHSILGLFCQKQAQNASSLLHMVCMSHSENSFKGSG